MALQWPEPVYVDGNFAVAEPVSLPEFSSPVRSTTAEYVFTQQWMQSRISFRPTPLNTAHPSYRQTPDYSAFKLVSEGPRQDVGGGIVKWTRTYARVPESHDEFESYAYSFIGFQGVWTVGNAGATVNATGRPRTSHVVTSRVHHDYFLVGPGGSYASAADIPVLKGQRYYGGDDPGPSIPLEVDYVMDALGGTPATSPSRTEYNLWIANALAEGFGSGVAPDGDTPGQICAEDSRLSRWNGNLWLRQSRYVLAQ